VSTDQAGLPPVRDAGTTGSFGTLVDSRRGWRSVPMVPVHLFGILRQRRAMIPVPATYLVALVVGAALGVAAQLVLGWRWWMVAAGVVAAVWLVFCSTALWGGGGSSRSLATEVLRVVSPRRAIERDHRQEVERFRAAPFPLYGLPTSWSGPRHLGGWGERWDQGRRRPVTTALSLAHGQPLAEEGPQLRVEVESYREGEQARPGGSERRRGLAEELWWEAAPTAHHVAQPRDQVAAAHRRPDSGWSRVTIPVDGRPVGFQWLARGRHWVAHAELDDRTLTLHGRDLPVESSSWSGSSTWSPTSRASAGCRRPGLATTSRSTRRARPLAVFGSWHLAEQTHDTGD
jgi:hypothetical protein